MEFTSTIFLKATSNNLTLSGWMPFSLMINPSGLLVSHKLVEMDYQWGDNTITSVTLFPCLSNNSSLPISAEPGDPRNFSVSHYYQNSAVSAIGINIGISAIQSGLSSPSSWNIQLQLFQPSSINLIMGSATLLEAKMFGTDNILYWLEGSTPDSLVPLLINYSPSLTTINNTTSSLTLPSNLFS